MPSDLPPFTEVSPLIASSKASQRRPAGKIFLAIVLCLLGVGVYTTKSATTNVTSRGDITTTIPKKLWTSWAMYSPYAAIDEYQTAPKGCRVIQANILQRHGARYPTSGASKAIVTALTKLSSVKEYTDSSLEFLRSHTYALGTDVMVPFGASQSLASGREHYERYKYLLSQEQLPFVRASSVERVVHTASNWTTGFSLASHHIYNPTLSVILYKDANTTLADSMCPNAGDAGAQKGAWVLKYASSIAARLNKHAPGANLTATDVYNLMNMCPFESVFYNRLSPFCNLFTQAEFEQLEYYGDLDKYYHTGYGQALGPVQGVGYINELIARLTGKPVNDNTQTNRTLDASPETFPLNRTIYADFSHDNQMIAIYSAMGLFRQSSPPNPTLPDPKRNWIISRLVPFSGRMITEKLMCTLGGDLETEYVRVFVNDALQPLEFCGAGKNGLCTLYGFVESQSYARNNGNGDFEKCYV